MSQGSRVLQSVEGRRFWLTEEALPSVECETCRWILRSYSFVSGLPVQLPGWPIRGVTSWRPTSRAGKVKGSQNTQKSKKQTRGCAILFPSPNLNETSTSPVEKVLHPYLRYGWIYFRGLLRCVQCFLCHLSTLPPPENRLIKTADWREQIEKEREGWRPKSPSIYVLLVSAVFSCPTTAAGQLMAVFPTADSCCQCHSQVII